MFSAPVWRRSAAARSSPRAARRDASGSPPSIGVAPGNAPAPDAPASPGSIPRRKRRAEFLRFAGAARKVVAPGLILQVLRRGPAALATSHAGGLPDANGIPSRNTASRTGGIALAHNRP